MSSRSLHVRRHLKLTAVVMVNIPTSGLYRQVLVHSHRFTLARLRPTMALKVVLWRWRYRPTILSSVPWWFRCRLVFMTDIVSTPIILLLVAYVLLLVENLFTFQRGRLVSIRADRAGSHAIIRRNILGLRGDH